MSDLFWLSDAQMARLEPFFLKSHGKPRIDDRRVLSGIIFINRNGLRWRDAPAAYGPHKTWCDCSGRSLEANEVRYVGLMDKCREENDLWKTIAGLDVSLKEISICVVDLDGKMIAPGTCPSDPEGVAGWFRNRSLMPRRIVHESGNLSIWLQRGMTRLGLPATCIDARKAHKSLSARLNKSDASDAEGLAQLARTGWFTAVHIRSEEADRLRCLVGARERLIRLRKDLEGHIRGVLKTSGIRMTGIDQGRHRQAFRDQLAAAGETDPVLRVMADAFIATHAKLCQVADDLDKAVKKTAKAHPVAGRLMTIPGVGSVNALSFIALVDDPGRFSRTSDLGAFLGLTPKRHQSGEMDWSGRVSKCGDGAMRGLLFEAASSVNHQVKHFSC